MAAAAPGQHWTLAQLRKEELGRYEHGLSRAMHSVQNALTTCSQEPKLSDLELSVGSALPSRPQTERSIPRPYTERYSRDEVSDGLLISNGASRGRIFYTPAAAAGVGLRCRRDRARQRSSGYASTGPLSDQARAKLLDDMAHFIPNEYCQQLIDYNPHRQLCRPSPLPDARQHFNSLLERLQQAQLTAAIENELRVLQPDKIWCRDNARYFHSPLSDRPALYNVEAWTRQIRPLVAREA